MPNLITKIDRSKLTARTPSPMDIAITVQGRKLSDGSPVFAMVLEHNGQSIRFDLTAMTRLDAYGAAMTVGATLNGYTCDTVTVIA